MATSHTTMNEQHVLTFDLTAGVIAEHDDGRFQTVLHGFTPGAEVLLPEGYTHLGAVLDGELELRYQGRTRRLLAGDFFSVVGPATVVGAGRGMASAARDYNGFNVFGGPMDPMGRLRYIDGCSDTLL